MDKQPDLDSLITPQDTPISIHDDKMNVHIPKEEASPEQATKTNAFKRLKTNFYGMIDITTKMIESINKQSKFTNYDLKNMAVSVGVIYDKIKDYELQEGKIKTLKNYEGLMDEYNSILSDIRKLVKNKNEKTEYPNKIREISDTSHNTNYVKLTPPSSICPTPGSLLVDASLTAKKNKVQKIVEIEGVKLNEDEII
jgi:hypothetical protein